MVKILERIREDGVPAIFSEPQFGAAVLGRAAEDAGVRVGTIYSDTVGAEVSSYIDMMRYNATSLLENLRKPLNPPFQKGGQGNSADPNFERPYGRKDADGQMPTHHLKSAEVHSTDVGRISIAGCGGLTWKGADFLSGVTMFSRPDPSDLDVLATRFRRRGAR